MDAADLQGGAGRDGTGHDTAGHDGAGAATGRTAFMIFTHYLTPRIRRLVDRARADLPHDVHVVGFFRDPAQAPEEFRTEPGFEIVTPDDLRALGYPAKAAADPLPLIPGNCDMIVLHFMRAHPEYDALWNWEGDADFTGDLNDFCGPFDRDGGDLACANVRWPIRSWPWSGWRVIPESWPADFDRPMRCFLPVCRVSRRFTEALDAFYRAGGDGHHEWSWTYVARVRDLVFEDFGGDGPFVREGRRNRFYLRQRNADLFPGTFQALLPMSRPGRRPGKLYHPIKDRPVTLREWLRKRRPVVRTGVLAALTGGRDWGQPRDVSAWRRFDRPPNADPNAASRSGGARDT